MVVRVHEDTKGSIKLRMASGELEVVDASQAAHIDPSNERSAHVSVDKMLATVRADIAAGKPFFVFANLLEPHLSYRPDPERAAVDGGCCWWCLGVG